MALLILIALFQLSCDKDQSVEFGNIEYPSSWPLSYLIVPEGAKAYPIIKSSLASQKDPLKHELLINGKPAWMLGFQKESSWEDITSHFDKLLVQTHGYAVRREVKPGTVDYLDQYNDFAVKEYYDSDFVITIFYNRHPTFGYSLQNHSYDGSPYEGYILQVRSSD